MFWDRELSGFGVRVYPSGAKVYVVQTRAGGKSRRITIGRHGLVSAEQARRKAAMVIASIKAGQDPGRNGSLLATAAGPERPSQENRWIRLRRARNSSSLGLDRASEPRPGLIRVAPFLQAHFERGLEKGPLDVRRDLRLHRKKP